jgi:hypothetical protein
MPPLKRHDGLTPDDAATLYAVTKARPPKLDRDHAAVIALAREIGADVADAIDFYEDRAAQREYEANVSREAAEAGALDDVRVIFLARLHR